MPDTFEAAFERVNQLVADFRANEKFYLSQQYQEAEARRDFIDKFLIALGWDVNHDTQKNPYEQEVKVERKEHGVSQRRADYAFYLRPNFRDVKFYIEAKKPFGDIATTDNYFQIIRYGWNSQTPIGALFDFEQFEIVDCRFKPDLDTALQRNIKKFHYQQFTDKEKFAEIYWLFSREAVANGSLEKFAETLPKKRAVVQRGLLPGGCQSIDESFLEELDKHRETLARIFKNSNPRLDGETLTEVTQRTLDRLVFIRFLEDKLIEPHYVVSKFGERGSAWGDFIATSRRLDGIYNGIVFKKNEILDGDKFKVDDGQFADICEELAHVNSPYDFNSIPIHILGSIYERFLGKVIVATDKRARVEEKPEVRKAGGVYYTPEYIVRYIVANTVGKLIEGKTPGQVAEMRFADIACGSGSFLLSVYDLLIRHHTKFYNDNPGKAKKGETMQREDGLHLSLQKKREILLNNIYGVDIDAQAVEVAQLSLYLKLLQDETPASAHGYQMEFHETLLPSLNKNIVCGNSLIGIDILSGELFEPVAERKLNPMDFEQRFGEIFKRGGFDAIVGNPPWGADFTDVALRYLREHYQRVISRMIDSYIYFIDRAIRAVKAGGTVGFIVPSTLLNQTDAKPTRELLLSGGLTHLISLGQGIFGPKVLNTSTIFITGDGNRSGFVIGNLSKVNSERRAEALFALHRPRDPQIFQSPKFIGLTTTKTITVIYDEKDNLFVTDAMYIFTPKPNLCPWALMAVMQSALFLFLYRLANQGESRVIPQIKASKLDTIPFPDLQAGSPKVKQLAELCKAMLSAKKQLGGAHSDKDKDFYENKCAALDRQIDALVYELYALTPDEIKIVESSGK